MRLGIRHFCTYPRIAGSTIVLSNSYPPRLRVPIIKEESVDVSLDPEMTVKQLEARVIEDIKCHFAIKADPETKLSKLV